MSNLLNGLVAAASSALSRNNVQSLDSAPKNRRTPLDWIYRNCVYYGIQIQRTVNTTIRIGKRVSRPLLRACAEKMRTAVVEPAINTKDTLKTIGSELAAASPAIGAAYKTGAMVGVRETVRVGAATAVNHKAFLASVVNHVLPVICIIALFSTAAAYMGRNYALAVECDGNVVGYIDDESTYTEAAALVGQRVLSSSEDFKNAITPTYSLVAVKDEETSSAQEICDNILSNSSDVDDAYGLFVDDELVAAVRSEGDLTFILDDFLDSFKEGAKANGTVSFVQDTEVVSGLYSTDVITTSADFKEKISAHKMVAGVHTVKSGDTVSGIAKKYGITAERVYELNEKLEESGLVKGDTIVIEKEEPVLAVKCVTVSTYTQSIAYSTITEKSSKYYTDQKKLKTKGENGVKEITQEITYIDGEEVSRKVIKTEVVKEPVNAVYVVGTKKRPTYSSSSNTGGGSSKPTTATGRFTWPVPGVRTVSSKYGYRWGRLHSGIDISNGRTNGRTIVAADSGKVTAVKYDANGYGKYLTISHGNGYSTLYAHCSSINVSKGQYVTKGQAIAKVGSTGRSTGPHLHFEIRVNGVAKNPMNYF